MIKIDYLKDLSINLSNIGYSPIEFSIICLVALPKGVHIPIRIIIITVANIDNPYSSIKLFTVYFLTYLF